MQNSLLVLSLTALLALTANAETFDKIEDLNGVSLKSGKENAIRSYVASTQKIIAFPVEQVKKAVTNFTERCNNSFKDKRKFSSKETDCKYHNENFIESFIERDIKPLENTAGVSEHYLIGRQVYNRGSYGFYELVTIREELNEQKQKTIKISLKMLSDNDVKLYTALKFEKESAFDESSTHYTLTEVSPTETHLNYEYSASTDHWLLNKQVSVPQVFASISKNINILVKTVEDECIFQKRELASKE